MTNTNPDDYLPAVPFVAFSCPACGEHKPRTYSVRATPGQRTVRYHKCLACGQKYRSFQLRPDEMHTWNRPQRGG